MRVRSRTGAIERSASGVRSMLEPEPIGQQHVRDRLGVNLLINRPNLVTQALANLIFFLGFRLKWQS
jgi:hypothetical protein